MISNARPLLSLRDGATITNVAYHPQRRRELYMTDSDTGQVLVAEVPVSGHPLASHG